MSEKTKPKKLDLKIVRNHKLERGTFKIENVTKATKIFHGQENGLLSYFVSVLFLYLFFQKKKKRLEILKAILPIHHQLNRYNYVAKALISGQI